MKTIITGILMFCCTSIFAQFPSASVTDPNIKLKAEQLTEQYSEHLALNGLQIPLFKNKIAHYLVLEEQIKREKKGREKLDALIEMRAAETLAMNDILTLYQYRLYKKVNFEVYPLEVVE